MATEVAADTVVVAAAMAPNVEDTVAKKEEATVAAAVATSAEDTEEETQLSRSNLLATSNTKLESPSRKSVFLSLSKLSRPLLVTLSKD